MKKLSKSEKRLQKKLEEQEKNRQKQIRFAESNSEFVQVPRVADAPKLQRMPRTNVPDIKVDKTPQIDSNPWSEIYDCRMTWCKSQADTSGTWTWGEPREWTDDEWNSAVMPNMNEMQRLTWNTILNEQKVKTKTGGQVPKHHHQEVSTLTREAQERWVQLNLHEYDTAFRFRFNGRTRAWGIRLQAHFYLIWWERYHMIYPVNQ